MGWKQPHKFSDVDRAFPAHVLEHLPPWEDIPQEYKDDSNPACAVAHRWFSDRLFTGPEAKEKGFPIMITKDGIEGGARAVFYHIDTILRSYQPKHEHKIAGIAMLIDQWVRSILRKDELIYGEDLLGDWDEITSAAEQNQ